MPEAGAATALRLSLSLLAYFAAYRVLFVAGVSTDVAVADPWLAGVGVTWAVFVHLVGAGFISRRWRAAVRRSVMNVSG